MNIERSMEITLNDPLTHTECEMLSKTATDHGIPVVAHFGKDNRMLRIEFDSDSEGKPLKNRLSLIANWFGTINGVETLGRVRDITDYYTDFVSEEVTKLTTKETT